MKKHMKKVAAWAMTLVLIVSCLAMPVFADGTTQAVVKTNTIKGTAFTENFSTLKAHIDADRTVPGNPVTYSGTAVIEAAGHKLDASEATISVAPGDGYYADDLFFNGSAAENLTMNADGSLSFAMHTGDLTWNNRGFPVAEGGMEFSAQGGDLNGQYHIRLAINGLTCDGNVLDEVIVMVYIYIYGREFSDMASPQNPGSSMWGTGSMGAAVLPYAEKTANPEPQQTGDSPVWNWAIRNWGEKDGYTEHLPVLCDKATDDFYVTWPAGADASALTADDVTITLLSEYGESEILKSGGDQKTSITGHNPSEILEIPAGDYAVYAETGETQISVNKIHWLTYPVYSKIRIEIDSSKIAGVDQPVVHEENIASVYLYSTQTGGGLDLKDTTVTVVSYYGIANVDELDVSDFYKNGGMYSYWAYSENSGSQSGGPQGGGPQSGGPQGGGSKGGPQGGGMFPQGPQGDLFLVLNEDGSVRYVTKDNSDPAVLLPAVKPAGWLGHSYYYTNYSSNETREVEYEGKTYTFVLKQPGMLGQLDAPSERIVPLPGYIQTIGGHYSDHMNAGWAFFLRDSEKDVGWTTTDRKLPFTDVGVFSSHCYNSVAWAYENGIINGVTPTLFGPDMTLSRGMAVTMLWRAAGEPAANSAENPFVDVQEGSWFHDAVLWAVEQGITNGTSETTFDPSASLTHEQAVAFLYRYAENASAAEDDFAVAAAWASEAGVADIAGNPGGVCTRFQALSYLYRVFGE